MNFSNENNPKNQHNFWSGLITNKLKKTIIISVIFIISIIVAVLSINHIQKVPVEPEIISTSNLKKILEVSELSTYECIYNGIVTVMNDEKEDKIDYHVSYEAVVKAGINFEEVDIKIDHETKIISVFIPQVQINSIEVDFSSMDFIFENKKIKHTKGLSADAYKQCEADVKNETNVNDAIFVLAEKNAINIIEGLLKPFIEQLDEGYKVEINQGGTTQ